MATSHEQKGKFGSFMKMFGSMEGIRMSIPLYVLVDSSGVIQYASHGGTNLEELVLKIESVIGK